MSTPIIPYQRPGYYKPGSAKERDRRLLFEALAAGCFVDYYTPGGLFCVREAGHVGRHIVEVGRNLIGHLTERCSCRWGQERGTITGGRGLTCAHIRIVRWFRFPINEREVILDFDGDLAREISTVLRAAGATPADLDIPYLVGCKHPQTGPGFVVSSSYPAIVRHLGPIKAGRLNPLSWYKTILEGRSFVVRDWPDGSLTVYPPTKAVLRRLEVAA